MKKGQVLAAVSAILAVTAVQAADTEAPAATSDDNVFTLGEVRVLGQRIADDNSSSTADDNVSAQEVWQFNANTLTDAIKLVPGVTSTFNTNGKRNEGDISVRGFDRWRVPLSIDGIRIYLPADNRIDFNRFLTPDLGEVQVHKGRASVLDGPGAMGGSINLVTRKPTQAFEAEGQAGATFDGEGGYNGNFETGMVGSRVGQWYGLVSYTRNDVDSWSLSQGFKPAVVLNSAAATAANLAAVEDGGKRNGSASEDWRVNAKIGWEPNETDEYSLSFTKQQGEKGAPLAVNFLTATGAVNTAAGYTNNSYWTWPQWDVQSAYWLSNTQFSNGAYVKTRLSYSEYDNTLYAWDNALYQQQTAGYTFISPYHDSSLGGSIETGARLLPDSTTSLAVFWRRDRHREYNDSRPDSTARSIEPPQHTQEKTWSVALQHDWKATSAIDLVGGVSYDKNEVDQAEEYGVPSKSSSSYACLNGASNSSTCMYEQALGGNHAVNGQLATDWHYTDKAELDFSVSSRTRFATNFERYSTRFGTAIPNPNLGAERGTNFEVDWKVTPLDGASASASVFYTDVQNWIQTVYVATATTQSQNVGDGRILGLELAGDYHLSPQWRLGANYSYLSRKITDTTQPNIRLTGAPDHLGFAYVAWEPVTFITVQPSIEFAGNRWTDLNGGSGSPTAPGTYQRIGEYTLVNMQVSWRPLDKLEATIGARNLLDRNYSLAAGFPQPGRSLFVKVKADL